MRFKVKREVFLDRHSAKKEIKTHSSHSVCFCSLFCPFWGFRQWQKAHLKDIAQQIRIYWFPARASSRRRTPNITIINCQGSKLHTWVFHFLIIVLYFIIYFWVWSLTWQGDTVAELTVSFTEHQCTWEAGQFLKATPTWDAHPHVRFSTCVWVASLIIFKLPFGLWAFAPWEPPTATSLLTHQVFC